MWLKRQRLHTSCVVSAVWFNTNSTQQAEVVQEAGKGGGRDQLSPDFPPAVLHPLDTSQEQASLFRADAVAAGQMDPQVPQPETPHLCCRVSGFLQV